MCGIIWVSCLLMPTLWMVWAGICYGQHKISLPFFILRYCDDILMPIVVPFIHDLILQHNTLLHVVRICTQFLEAEHILACIQQSQKCYSLSMLGKSVLQYATYNSNLYLIVLAILKKNPFLLLNIKFYYIILYASNKL